MSFFDCRIVIVITGASRGIGREIAVQVAKRVAQGSTFILVARNTDGLNETRDLILENKTVMVKLVSADLSQTNSHYLDQIKEHLVSSIESNSLVLVVHNAGTLGAIDQRAEELNSGDDWHEYLQLNLVSTILLNNLVYNMQTRTCKKAQLFVVDITSLAATTAFPSFTQYSVGKAAREAYFRAFAVESPSVRVLSYSPGPVDTNMRKDVLDRSHSEDLRRALGGTGGSDVNRQILTTKQTVDRLIQILKSNDFKSGSRIDYFDS